MMDNNKKLTNLDVQQIQRYSYDEENNAQRVVIVNQQNWQQNNVQGQHANYPQTQFNSVQQGGLNLPQTPVVIKETVIEKIDVPVYITDFKEIIKTVVLTEYKEISVPFPVKEVVIEKIEVGIPIVTEKIQVVEIPKIITEYKVIEKPSMKYFCIGFSVGILIMLVCHFIKF